MRWTHLYVPILLALASACSSSEDDSPTAHFTIHDDGTVLDNETGYLWEHHADTGVYTQAEALDYCRALRLAAHDWALPSLDELLTIRAGFPELLEWNAHFWTSDPPRQAVKNGREEIELVWTFAPSETGVGGPGSKEPTERHHVRCFSDGH